MKKPDDIRLKDAEDIISNLKPKPTPQKDELE
jgi:hypothetical protein